MANALYGKGKEKLLTAAINLSSDTIKAALMSSAYTPNLSTNEFLSDISANVLNTAQTLGTKTITLGVFDAADITYTAVTASTSALLAYIDTIVGFPLATNGGDITIIWDSGANKIFAL